MAVGLVSHIVVSLRFNLLLALDLIPSDTDRASL